MEAAMERFRYSRRNRLLKNDRRDQFADRRERCGIGIGRGLGKRAYSSEGQAKRASADLAGHYDQPLRAYRCACGAWHLTTKEKW